MQNTKQSHRSMLSGGEYRITMKLKQSMASIPRLDFLAFNPRQSERYCIENGLLSNLMFAREKKLTNVFLLLLVVDMVLLYLYYRLESLPVVGPLWLPLSCALHLLNTVVFTLLTLMQSEENKIMRRENNSVLYSLAALGGFLVIHPAPCWQGQTVELTYDDRDFTNLSFPVPLNHLIIITSILKGLYLIFTRQLINTHYLNPRGKRLKGLFSVTLTQQMYAVKCIFKQSPIRMFIFFYLAGYFFFSFAFQITESTVPIESNPFIYFWNCLWFTFITSSTVGYGDLRIFTHAGYILDVCCMVWGTLITSCILVILTNTLTLNSKEEESLSSLKRVEVKIQYRNLCKLYVRESLWRLWINKRYRKNRREPVKERKMRQKLCQLRFQEKMFNPSHNIAELSQREFDICVNSASQLHSNNVDLINFIGTHIFSEVLIRQKESGSSSFIDRSEDKQLEDNIQEQSVSSQKSLVQSVSSISSATQKREPMSRFSVVRSKKPQCLNVQDMQSSSSGKSADYIKQDGI